MIYEQELRPVDPLRLAGFTMLKARRFAAPVPPVMTPFLLTAQLKNGLGVCCADCMKGGMIPPDYGSLRGLGVYSCPTTANFSIGALGTPVAAQGGGAISMLQTLANGANFVPGVGTIGTATAQTFISFVQQFAKWFDTGSREANIIVPVQNQMIAHFGTITNQFLTGTTPSVSDLGGFYRDVWSSGVAFQEFVLMCNFTDRRASGQALNTVMPYIDGSCGYAVPLGLQAVPTQFNCLEWGDGTLGGPGMTGMLGALSRAIVAAGGTAPVLPDLHQSANTGIKPSQILNPLNPILSSLPATIAGISTPLVLAGVVAFFLLSK